MERPVTQVIPVTPETLEPADHHDRLVYQIDGLTKVFSRNNFKALSDVSLTLAKGEFAAVIGSSGCGKSTLLKIMAGLMPPTSGRVMLEGRPVMGPSRDIGMMFQQATLLPWKTTLENILLPIEMRDGKRARLQALDRARQLLKLVGLARAADIYPNELSGGMAQRAAICRMLITDPTVLLLDEPFSALDELTRDFMNMEFQRICLERHATAFLVTHSIPEAVILADKIFIMEADPGHIVEVIDIDLPRPRTLDLINTAKFGEIVNHIREKLNREDFM